MYSILIIEDEQRVADLLRAGLEENGYNCLVAYDGAMGLRMFRANTFDLVISDIVLPKMDGFELCKEIRAANPAIPILMLTALGSTDDKLDGFDAGADDYLTKPFSIDELLARLRAALRRRQLDDTGLAPQESVYRNGNLSIDYAAGCVYRDDREIHLTPIEYKLLCVLAKNTGKVLTHNYILKEVWGNAFSADASSLRVFMATLRKKIEENPATPQYIQTHIGVGYRMIRQ